MALEFELLARVLLAGLLGGAVGWERERRHKPAGLRTHMLVTMGSAMFVAVGVLVTEEAAGEFEVVRLDIQRVVAAVATGIGFLGAGAIIRAGGSVRGLTTAAGIWMNAGIGMAAGLGYILLAVGATVLTVLVISVLPTARPGERPELEEAPDPDAEPGGEGGS